MYENIQINGLQVQRVKELFEILGGEKEERELGGGVAIDNFRKVAF